MESISPRFKEIIYSKLNDDLKNAIFYPYGREIWIINMTDKTWYFQSDNLGYLWYNQIFFNQFFLLFSLKYSEYQPLLLSWFQDLTGLQQRSISRKNTNYNYMIIDVIENKKQKWSLVERYGFSYPIVKKYIDLKKNLKVENIKVSDISDYGVC